MNNSPKAFKIYVVRKYVKATSVIDAVRKEKDAPVHEVFIDEEWRRNSSDQLAPAIGFTTSTQ